MHIESLITQSDIGIMLGKNVNLVGYYLRKNPLKPYIKKGGINWYEKEEAEKWITSLKK